MGREALVSQDAGCRPVQDSGADPSLWDPFFRLKSAPFRHKPKRCRFIYPERATLRARKPPMPVQERWLKGDTTNTHNTHPHPRPSAILGDAVRDDGRMLPRKTNVSTESQIQILLPVCGVI